MAGGIKIQGRSHKRRRLSGGFSEINVTPLVDVMLVLLVVFMITAPMLNVGVPVDLPKTKAAKMNDQVEPLVVSVDAQGRSYLQETELEGEALVARLMAITNSNPEAKIYVRGDKILPYGRIMEIMGEIAAAGFHRVSLIAEMPTPSLKAPVKTPNLKPSFSSLPGFEGADKVLSNSKNEREAMSPPLKSVTGANKGFEVGSLPAVPPSGRQSSPNSPNLKKGKTAPLVTQR